MQAASPQRGSAAPAGADVVLHVQLVLKDIVISYCPNKCNDMLNSVLFDIINSEQDLASHSNVEDMLFVPVTTHRRNISNKLQIHSSAGIAIYAIVNGLLNLHEIEKMP